MDKPRLCLPVPNAIFDECIEVAMQMLATEEDREIDRGRAGELVEKVLLNLNDGRNEGLSEAFEDKTSKYYQELVRLLAEPFLQETKRQIAEAKLLQGVLFEERPNEFNGQLAYEPERLGAMIVHIAYRTQNLFPTRLNKLIFYGDFHYYGLKDQSMTGAEYIKLTHGPVFSGYQGLLKDLEKRRKIKLIRIKSKGKDALVIRPAKSYRPGKSLLTKEERRLLDWVVGVYGPLSTKDLIAMSHREMGYWDTNWRQPIDYKFAHELELKPPQSLLD